MGQFLITSLPSTDNGAIAFLLTDTGDVVASSSKTTNVSDPNNPYVRVMSQRLSQWLLSPTNISVDTVTVDGTQYYLQTTAIDTGVQGLLWVLPIFTPTAAFIGQIDSNNRTTLILSAAVVCVCIVITFVLVSLINRPLERVLKFMNVIAKRSEPKTRGRSKSKSSDGGGSAASVVTDKDASDGPSKMLTTRSATVPDGAVSNGTIAQLHKVKTTDTTKHSATDKDAMKQHQHHDEAENSDVLSSDELYAINEEWIEKNKNRSFVTRFFTSREVKLLYLKFGDMLNRLTKSQTHVEESNRAKRRFLRFVFHEVRVPLNAVTLGIDDIQSNATVRNIDETTVDTVNIMADQVKSITRILNDVLSLQRIEDGEMKLEFLPFCLESMVISTIDAFVAELQHKTLQCTVQLNEYNIDAYNSASSAAYIAYIDAADRAAVTNGDGSHAVKVDERCHHVTGDKYRLRQCISNLLSNAVKFTPQDGTIKVIVQCHRISSHQQQQLAAAMQCSKDTVIDVDEKHHCHGEVKEAVHSQDNIQATSCDDIILVDDLMHVRITVADSGAGMSETEKLSLFQPYRQFSSGALQEGKGSGLGLSIARRLIELHSGSLSLDYSEKGKGSEFSIRLPMRPVPFDNRANYNVLHSSHKKHLANNGKLRNLPRLTESSATSDTSSSTPDLNVNTTRSLRVMPLDSDDMPVLLSSASPAPYNTTLAASIADTSSNNSSTNSQSSAYSPLRMTRQLLPSARVPSTHQSVVTSDGTSSAQTAHSVAQKPALQMNGISTQNKLSILCVEDSTPNLKLLIRLLESLGYNAHGLDNGQLCYDAFQQHVERQQEQNADNGHITWPYDLVLMDGYVQIAFDRFDYVRVAWL